jgi:single-stranded DNA-binding protein
MPLRSLYADCGSHRRRLSIPTAQWGADAMIDCAFFGFLAADAETKVSKAGKTWARLRVGVGKDDNLQWVSVTVFGQAAEVAAKLKKGDRCYVEGSIKVDTWMGNDGTERHGLSVASFKIEKTHNIGRNRLENGRISVAGGATSGQSLVTTDSDFHNDPLPEWGR